MNKEIRDQLIANIADMEIVDQILERHTCTFGGHARDEHGISADSASNTVDFMNGALEGFSDCDFVHMTILVALLIPRLRNFRAKMEKDL